MTNLTPRTAGRCPVCEHYGTDCKCHETPEHYVQRVAQRLWEREGRLCLSYLVSEMARSAFDMRHASDALNEMCEQAAELAAPIDDWEEAAVQAGWERNVARVTGNVTYAKRGDKTAHMFDSWQDLCESENLDPYPREVFEFWAVSDWLADELIAAGEKVEKDFAGLCVWARTTTGQAVYSDGVIERIAVEAFK